MWRECGGFPTREGGLFVVGREAGSAASEKEGIEVHMFKRKKKRKEKNPHSSMGKYCLVVMVMILALGPDCLRLNPGSSVS